MGGTGGGLINSPTSGKTTHATRKKCESLVPTHFTTSNFVDAVEVLVASGDDEEEEALATEEEEVT